MNAEMHVTDVWVASFREKEHYAKQFASSMAMAIAERFVYELLLTDKWDHLFHWVAIKQTENSFSFGFMNDERRAEGYVTAYESNRLPRIIAGSDFVIRVKEWNNTLRELPAGYRMFKFELGKDMSVTVTVAEHDLYSVSAFFLSGNLPPAKRLATEELLIL